MIVLFDYSPRAFSPFPAQGAELADIGPVAIRWAATRPDIDPLDEAGFTISREGVAFTVEAGELAPNVFEASADVGLFPVDSPAVLASARTVAGYAGESAWSFSCRDGSGGDTLAELNGDFGSSIQTVAELTQAQVAAAAAGAEIASDYGSGSQAAASLSTPGAMVAGPVHAQVGARELTAGSIIVEHFAREFGDVGEATLARFHHVLAFVTGAGSTVEAGAPVEVAARVSELVEGFINQKIFPHTLRVGGETRGSGLIASFDEYRAKLSPGSTALTTGPEQTAAASVASETTTGSGVDSLFDIDDGTLDSLMDE